jgi:hypothetical protein
MDDQEDQEDGWSKTGSLLKIWIFDDGNQVVPNEFLYDTNSDSPHSNLDSLPMLAV